MTTKLLFNVVISTFIYQGQGVVNFSLHKSTNQSSTLYYHDFKWTADKAVDGNEDGRDPETRRTCSATIETTSLENHTWEVDIGFQIIVKTITVYGRTDKDKDPDKDQLNGVKLYLGNTSGPWSYSHEFMSDAQSSTEKTKYVFKPGNVIARFISLMRNGYILTICEVTVEGECRHGTYGPGCNEICGNCYKGNSRCSPTDGMCMEGCDAGWIGDICKNKCKAGTYGFGCNETCGHCLNEHNNCSHMHGQCISGCQVGWKGETCKSACISGTYGSGCNETCGNCYNMNISCLLTDGRCTEGCAIGWRGDTCKLKCEAGTYGFHCNETCGYCINRINNCSEVNGQCNGGCQAGWTGETCKSECEEGTYGFNCNETCGYCSNGKNSCSKISGQCSDGCQTGWRGEACTSGMLETVTPGDVGPNTGVIIGSVLAAVGVSIFAMVIIIVIVKKRKRNNNETGTENVTPFTNYANLVVGNPDAAITITVPSREKRETAFAAIEETSLQNGMPIGATNSHSGVMEADVPVHNVYEKLRDVPESTESAYSTIDQNLIHDQTMNTIENGSNYIETLQELESALKSIEDEIGVLLDRKGKLLCKELERSRAIKLRDKRKETDSSQSDTNKDYTYVNLESKDALERCGNFVEMLQSLEGELRLLEEKRKCLFERNETLLSQELAKTFKI